MLIVGCGYIGRLLGADLLRDGRSVTGVVSSQESRVAVENAGIRAVVADLDDTGAGLPLSDADSIFYLAPPPGDGVRDLRVKRFLGALTAGARTPRIIYMGTTSVYGDCGGEWADETRPAQPATDRARRRLDAEQQFMVWSKRNGGEVILLRVAGIYGPGRLPIAYLKTGGPMLREEDAPFSNRIHAADLVTVCRAAMDRGRNGSVYNVADGSPTTMTDYFNRVAGMAGLARPRPVSMEEARSSLSPGLLSYLKENRRIDVAKMMEELGVTLRYPTLSEGLAADAGPA